MCMVKSFMICWREAAHHTLTEGWRAVRQPQEKGHQSRYSLVQHDLAAKHRGCGHGLA